MEKAPLREPAGWQAASRAPRTVKTDLAVTDTVCSGFCKEREGKIFKVSGLSVEQKHGASHSQSH